MSPTTTPAATLRPATAADLPRVEALLVAAQLPLHGVREALPDFVVAEAQGALVGVAGLEVCRSDALLRSVAVADAWRSRGVGRALVTRVISDAEARPPRPLPADDHGRALLPELRLPRSRSRGRA